MPKLINIDEDIPEHFYVFVNISNPMAWHNMTFTKTLFSGVFPGFSFDKEVLEKYLKGTYKKTRWARYNPTRKKLETIPTDEFDKMDKYKKLVERMEDRSFKRRPGQ